MMIKKSIRLAVVIGLMSMCVQVSAAQTTAFKKTFTPKKLVDNAVYMQQIESELNITKQEYNSISSSISHNKKKLTEIHNEILSLQDQLNNLDLVSSETENKIMNVMKQITQKKNEMQVLGGHIDTKHSILEEQLEVVADVTELLYLSENEYGNTYRALLSAKPMSELSLEQKYARILQNEGMELAENLKDISFELDQNKKSLIVKSAKLAKLKEDLANEREKLSNQREAKENLLVGTKGEEEIYLELIAQSKSQQDAALTDINTLNDNLGFLREKLREYGASFDTDDYKTLVNKRSRAVFEYTKTTTGDVDLAWPASPSRGISAYYLDPAYKSTFGVPHHAIDIRIPQKTKLLAAEDGIVYRAKDNGMGYSYIILAHKGGFMTVYGHVYEMRVKEGDIVHKGDVIGLSGGMPGTKGAGYMTTGPHLHFEILKNGVHKDPLDYLSLLQLPLESLPEKYAEKLRGETKKVKRISDDEEALTEEDFEKFVETEGTYGYEEDLDIDIEEFIDF
jgi:murein DD-endopeptidase MepM/ murein hydrolase activator NlpD